MREKVRLDAGDLRLGEISGLHGVQGWVKVFSDTKPRENIFEYQPWCLYGAKGKSRVEVLRWRKQGKTLVAQLQGLNEREQARELIGAVIAVKNDSLPPLEKGEYYWSQLVGLRVKTFFSSADEAIDLGVVDQLVETGANDVLVVSGDQHSLDETERLIPWVPDQFILDVDVKAGEIRVDWDPDF